MKIQVVDIQSVKENSENPRIIKDDKFKKLVKSIKEFPEMLEIRPIVVDESGVVLGGNMRLKACKEAGLKEIPIIKASQLTEEQKREFVLKDNQSYGEWDTKLLANWNKDLLLNSGFEQWDMIDIFGMNEMTEGYKKEIEGSNFNAEEVNVDDYIKQNIFFLNEMMIEFRDDDIKEKVRQLNSKGNIEDFLAELKKLIYLYA
jgi:ParB-like chromosome segregation protein Spo0J